MMTASAGKQQTWVGAGLAATEMGAAAAVAGVLRAVWAALRLVRAAVVQLLVLRAAAAAAYAAKAVALRDQAAGGVQWQAAASREHRGEALTNGHALHASRAQRPWQFTFTSLHQKGTTSSEHNLTVHGMLYCR